MWDLKKGKAEISLHIIINVVCINDSGHTSPKSEVSQNLPDEPFLEFVCICISVTSKVPSRDGLLKTYKADK